MDHAAVGPVSRPSVERSRLMKLGLNALTPKEPLHSAPLLEDGSRWSQEPVRARLSLTESRYRAVAVPIRRRSRPHWPPFITPPLQPSE